MGKIFYMMGKSSSGKDTVYKEIRKRASRAEDADIIYDQTDAGR